MVMMLLHKMKTLAKEVNEVDLFISNVKKQNVNHDLIQSAENVKAMLQHL
jgi:hypothetical protein